VRLAHARTMRGRAGAAMPAALSVVSAAATHAEVAAGGLWSVFLERVARRWKGGEKRREGQPSWSALQPGWAVKGGRWAGEGDRGIEHVLGEAGHHNACIKEHQLWTMAHAQTRKGKIRVLAVKTQQSCEWCIGAVVGREGAASMRPSSGVGE
jgi:hypothetical protein